MILCTQCGHTNLDDAKHCASCAAVLPAMSSCPSCESSVSVDAWFCAHCGTALRSATDPSTPTVDPLAPTNVVGLADASHEPSIPPTQVVGTVGTAQTVPGEIPATEVINMDPTMDPTMDPASRPPEEPLHEIPATEVVTPAAVRQPPDLFADPDASLPPPPPMADNQSVEFTTFPNTDSVEAAFDGMVEAQPEAEPPDTPPLPAPDPSIDGPAAIDPVQPSMAASPTLPVDPPPPSPPTAFPMGATQIQQPTARFVHVYSDVAVPIPSHLHMVHIGKPNDRVPPDIDVSGFADSDVVSRVHASLRLEADGYYLEDTGSANGTYVNNQALRLGDRYRLRTGDRVSLGKEDKVSFIFHSG